MPHRTTKPKRDDLPLDNSEAMNESPIPNISAEELGQHIVYLRREMREIRDALMGNDLGNVGLIQRVITVEKQGEVHDRKLLVWGSILSAAGIVLVFIKDYIRKF